MRIYQNADFLKLTYYLYIYINGNIFDKIYTIKANEHKVFHIW